MEKHCSRCHQAPITAICGGCWLVGYCNPDCANADWGSHYRAIHTKAGEHVADQVLPDVWIGGVEALTHADIMSQIQAVLTIFPKDRVSEQRLAACLRGKDTLRIEVDDKPDAPIERYFDQAADWIAARRAEGKGVLVHCFGGRSRSPTLVIYYMLKYFPHQYPSVLQALAALRKKRPYAQPNPGFMAKLEVAHQRLRAPALPVALLSTARSVQDIAQKTTAILDELVRLGFPDPQHRRAGGFASYDKLPLCGNAELPFNKPITLGNQSYRDFSLSIVFNGAGKANIFIDFRENPSGVWIHKASRTNVAANRLAEVLMQMPSALLALVGSSAVGVSPIAAVASQSQELMNLFAARFKWSFLYDINKSRPHHLPNNSKIAVWQSFQEFANTLQAYKTLLLEHADDIRRFNHPLTTVLSDHEFRFNLHSDGSPNPDAPKDTLDDYERAKSRLRPILELLKNENLLATLKASYDTFVDSLQYAELMGPWFWLDINTAGLQRNHRFLGLPDQFAQLLLYPHSGRPVTDMRRFWDENEVPPDMQRQLPRAPVTSRPLPPVDANSILARVPAIGLLQRGPPYSIPVARYTMPGKSSLFEFNQFASSLESEEEEHELCGKFFYYEPDSAAHLLAYKPVFAVNKVSALRALGYSLEMVQKHFKDDDDAAAEEAFDAAAAAAGIEKDEEQYHRFYDEHYASFANQVDRFSKLYKKMLEENDPTWARLFECALGKQRSELFPPTPELYREYYNQVIELLYNSTLDNVVFCPELSAFEDYLDGLLCRRAALYGYDAVVLARMCGETRLVSEVLATDTYTDIFSKMWIKQ